jgi:serine/threonine protein kinase
MFAAPGAGKTIMAGLLTKELRVRGDLQRCLIVCPGNLAEQWQDEMDRRFHLPFEIMTNDALEAARTGNWFLENSLVICRLDKLSRNEDVQAKLRQTDWDLIVGDEAHKLSATYFGNEIKYTKRYRLAQLLSPLTRHFLLLTATPHNGKEADFQLFMALLVGDRFEGKFRDGVHVTDPSDMMRRLVKEQLLKFDGTPLFPERRAYTPNYALSDPEAELYKQVTDHVRRKGSSMLTPAGPWLGSSSSALLKVRTAWRRPCARRRTPLWAVWSRPASSRRVAAECSLLAEPMWMKAGTLMRTNGSTDFSPTIGLALTFRARDNQENQSAVPGGLCSTCSPAYAGHRWQASVNEPQCPECGLASQPVADESAARESYAPVDVLPPQPQPLPNHCDWPLIPGYEILDECARGGMGVVYRARQTSLNRIVALKMLATGPLASPSEVARFRAEAEAVARFQHPNIVQVHDVGEHHGRLYMALEFIEGGSLSGELAGAPLHPEASARLVETLAHAVHYAHERSIVHRDLKPSNILLYRKSEIQNPKTARVAGGTSSFELKIPNFEPKVCDFGLAKCLDHDSSQTCVGEVMGTPSYMAPEQASGMTREIGPAADVYALGAILYELVTGRPPFRAATSTETIRQVLAEDPVPPSRLQPAVPRDLNTICLKCLEKEPRKRYGNARELAADLHHFIVGEPIRARPTAAWERALKWMRRRPALAAVYAVSAAAALGLLFTVLLYNRSLERQRDVAVSAEQETERSLALALDAAQQFQTKVAGSALVNVPGQELLRVELLERAREFYEKVAQMRANDPEIRAELARTIWQLGVLKGEVESKARGIVLLQEAADIQGNLARDYTDNTAYRKDLARTWNNLGILLRGSGKQKQALVAWQSALAMREDLARQHPEDADIRRDLAQSQHNLGNFYRNLGEGDKAESAYMSARSIQEQLARAHPDLSRHPKGTRYHRDLALTCFNLGGLYHDLVQLEKANERYHQALQTQQKLVAAHPKVQQFQRDLSQTLFYLGNLHRDGDRIAEALKTYEQALLVEEALCHDFPKFIVYQADLAQGYLALAQALYETGSFERAEELTRKGLDLEESLCRQHPDSQDYRVDLAALSMQLGELAADTGRSTQAAASYQRALQLREELASRDVSYASDLAVTLLRLGDLDRTAAYLETALDHYQRALALLKKSSPGNADAAGWQISLARCYNRLGAAFHANRQRDEARSAWEQAMATLRKSAPGGTPLAHRRRQRELASVQDGLGSLAFDADRLSDATAHFQRAFDLRQQLAGDEPQELEILIELAQSLARQAALAKRQGGLPDALAYYDRALSLLKAVLQREKRHVRAQDSLRNASAERAAVLAEMKRRG